MTLARLAKGGGGMLLACLLLLFLWLRRASAAAGDSTMPRAETTPRVPTSTDVPTTPRSAVDGYPTATHYTKNFKRKELDPLQAATTKQQNALYVTATMLETLRHEAGDVKLTVTSHGGLHPLGTTGGGWPSRTATSTHRRGEAGDVFRGEWKSDQMPLFVAALGLWELGIIKGLGFYDGYVHVDTKPGAKRKPWDYRKKDKRAISATVNIAQGDEGEESGETSQAA